MKDWDEETILLQLAQATRTGSVMLGYNMQKLYLWTSRKGFAARIALCKLLYILDYPSYRLITIRDACN